MRRPAVLTSLLALAVVLVTPGTALADAAGPTNYRSEILEVSPDVPGIEVEVLGGDAFVHLTVDSGVEVFVPGYETEEGASPYLWFADDGTVLVNERSPAFHLNDARYGSRDVAVPSSADPFAPPVWVPVASGGTYAWHDHRIHWMSPTVPDQVDAGAGTVQPVFDWDLPLVVEGQDVTVRGELVWVPSRSGLVPGVVALLVAVGSLALVRRDRRVAPLVGGLAALVGLAVAGMQNVGLPAGAVGPFVPLLLSGVGLLGALVAVALRGRDETQATVLAVLAVLPVAASVLVQWRGLVAPEVPSSLGPVLFGALLAVALGAAVGVVIGGVGSLITPLEPDPAPAER